MTQSIEGVESLETTLTFDRDLFTDAYAHCSGSRKAKQLSQIRKNIVSEGVDQLVALDKQTKGNVSKVPFTEAVESLAILAAVRESIEVIENTAI